MVQTEMSVGTKRMLTAVQTCLIIIATLVPFCWGEEREEGSGCVYARFLENPYYKERYLQSLTSARIWEDSRENDSEGMYGTIVQASISNRDGSHLGGIWIPFPPAALPAMTAL